MDITLNRLNQKSAEAIQNHCMKVLDAHRAFMELRTKAEVIDTHYYRYQTEGERQEGDQSCGVTVDNLVIPVVISQVDSFVGYLGELYLSGYPIFPVVSTPETVQYADKMEAVVDSHAMLGGYARQLLKAYHQGIRYNFMPILCEWKQMPMYGIVQEALNTKKGQRLQQASKGYTCIKSLDIYNTIWDYRFSPADAAIRGDFIGYVDRISRTELKALMNQLSIDKIAYNRSKWNQIPGAAGTYSAYFDPPAITQYITPGKTRSGVGFDWAKWLGADQIGNNKLAQSSYEIAYIYIRIIPSDFGIDTPMPQSPQLFKCYLINGQLLIGFERCITPYGRFPIEIGMPIEDNFGLQTPSIAEGQAGYQAAASTLFNIRIQGARRAVMDRALYDTDAINSSDVNSKHPPAKIPVRLKGLSDKGIQDVYYPIPFQSAGLESVVGNMGDILKFADMLSGLNPPSRGQFQKGNKSVEEWRDTMGGADNRLRLPALNIEFQSMIPIKEQIKFNLFMKGEPGTYTNMKTGSNAQVTAEDYVAMQENALSFRIADGYTPKSKMASSEFIGTLIQMLSTSVPLQQQLGPMLPAMVVHLAQLQGVRDLSQYLPKQVAQPQQPSQGTPANGQQPAAGSGQPAV